MPVKTSTGALRLSDTEIVQIAEAVEMGKAFNTKRRYAVVNAMLNGMHTVVNIQVYLRRVNGLRTKRSSILQDCRVLTSYGFALCLKDGPGRYQYHMNQRGLDYLNTMLELSQLNTKRSN